jgi:hypothetical protein
MATKLAPILPAADQPTWVEVGRDSGTRVTSPIWIRFGPGSDGATELRFNQKPVTQSDLTL